MIMKFKKIPVVVDAVQWTGDNENELLDFGLRGNFDFIPMNGYIVKDEKGDFVAYSEDAFYKTYERHLVWDENI